VKNVENIMKNVQHVKKIMNSVHIVEHIIQNVADAKNMANIMRANAKADVLVVANIVKKNINRLKENTI